MQLFQKAVSEAPEKYPGETEFEYPECILSLSAMLQRLSPGNKEFKQQIKGVDRKQRVWIANEGCE